MAMAIVVRVAIDCIQQHRLPNCYPNRWATCRISQRNFYGTSFQCFISPNVVLVLFSSQSSYMVQKEIMARALPFIELDAKRRELFDDAVDVVSNFRFLSPKNLVSSSFSFILC